MKIVISGSRPPKEIRSSHHLLYRWYNKHGAVVQAAVSASGFNVTEIIQGDAQGFDTLARRWAAWNHIPCIGYPAEWKRPDGGIDYAAGKCRNVVMADDAEALISIWNEESRGTAHMIAIMASLDKPVFVWSFKQHAPMLDAVAKAYEIMEAKPESRRVRAGR